jgi:subfamily B ATP-binding cassette protein HlyB/CyaB
LDQVQNPSSQDGPQPGAAPQGDSATQASPLEVRILAVMAAARYHGVELDREDLRFPRGETPPPAALVEWARTNGLWANGTKFRWKHLLQVQTAGPVVLLLADGSAALMVRADPARNVVWLKDPLAGPESVGIPVDELRLAQVWNGEVLLLRPERGTLLDNEPFGLMWVARLVWLEKPILRDIFLGSLVLSLLSILPAMLVMIVIDKVITYQSYSTLAMITTIVIVVTVYEMYLGYIRRQLMLIVGTRLDAKLALHVFKRLLALPIDYFERTQTGAVMFQVGQITKLRDFLTGKLMTTLIDLIMVLVLLPILFWLSPLLTWIVLGGSVAIALTILAFLKPMRRVFGNYLAAEIQKNTVLVESVQGIRTVKSLALEPQQRELWDRRSADAASWRKSVGNMSNWTQTLVSPWESLINRGVLLFGAYIALVSPTGVSVGSLLAFMMLSNRVAAPLVSMAKLIEDAEEMRTATGLAGQVLNMAPETQTPGAGLRPRFAGAISFDNVNFTYPGTKNPALEKVSFEVPAGTMLGLVGRSGSGKSTVTRLLQGINREYEGTIKIDGNDLREINLAHLRRSFGVVLQENFLFRGSIKDNIIAGRPGLTLTDAVRAARLAGAEEFIERLPTGYETWIEEGSPNLSGGQRQRLAIARALIHDPRLLILDEATSALDPESEALVNANIQRIAHGRTMMIVSHRLSSLVDCQNILVLDKGHMIDIAPHEVLLERCTIYRQLWLQQHRHLESQGMRGSKTALAPSV